MFFPKIADILTYFFIIVRSLDPVSDDINLKIPPFFYLASYIDAGAVLYYDATKQALIAYDELLINLNTTFTALTLKC